MPSNGSLDPESEDFLQARPTFWMGQHDSARIKALTDNQYSHILNSGVGFNALLTLYHTATDILTNSLLSLASPPRQSPVSTSMSG